MTNSYCNNACLLFYFKSEMNTQVEVKLDYVN